MQCDSRGSVQNIQLSILVSSSNTLTNVYYISSIHTGPIGALSRSRSLYMSVISLSCHYVRCLSIYHTGSDTVFDAIWRVCVDISHWEWHSVRCNRTSVCRYITLGVTLCPMQSDECLSIYHTGSDTLFDAIWRVFVNISHWEWHSVRCNLTSVCRYITLGVTFCSMQSD